MDNPKDLYQNTLPYLTFPCCIWVFPGIVCAMGIVYRIEEIDEESAKMMRKNKTLVPCASSFLDTCLLVYLPQYTASKVLIHFLSNFIQIYSKTF